jgi:hypothetical protein
MRKKFAVLVSAVLLPPVISSVYAEEFDAAKVDKFPVLQRGDAEIKIDAAFDDWKLAKHVLVMGKETWEPFQGGTRDNDDDITARLQIVYDENNLYFALIVKDDEFVAEGGNPWENDGIQIAIDASGGKIDPGFPNGTTHLYNFSIGIPWQKEAGNWLGDATIELKRDETAKQNLFEWQMPTEIFAKKGAQLEAGMELAFAIIANDSDKNAKGQKGWVGWGSQTIVFGKNPEEMKTLVLEAETLAVDPRGKLSITWGAIKKS